MNKLFLAAGLIFLASLTSCGGSDESAAVETEITTDNVESTTTMEFTEEVFDFGAITQGEKVEHTFKFRNTGDADLVIVSAKGSCGCTVPSWPKEPIAAGQEGEMKVIFSSEGKKGKQHKRVTVVANTEPSTTVVALKGDVIAPEEAAAEESTESTTEE